SWASGRRVSCEWHDCKGRDREQSRSCRHKSGDAAVSSWRQSPARTRTTANRPVPLARSFHMTFSTNRRRSARLLAGLGAACALAAACWLAAPLLLARPQERQNDPPAPPAQEKPAQPRPQAEEPKEKLPIAQVILYSSGVGYFQREGTVEGDA